MYKQCIGHNVKYIYCISTHAYTYTCIYKNINIYIYIYRYTYIHTTHVHMSVHIGANNLVPPNIHHAEPAHSLCTTATNTPVHTHVLP